MADNSHASGQFAKAESGVSLLSNGFKYSAKICKYT